ncbi:porin [uncultured Chryseobacterium sp.]|uniref:porin n=1 Tax=uncultured Chryseobacterium sp. TaxID=259322 RepID=UPI0025DD10ED|nr:porin [uncultured Chryseobacterium sp.]
MDRTCFKTGLIIALLLGMSQTAEAQKKNDFGNPALTHYLNEQRTRYISFSGYAELWARYAQLNPGSMINNDAKSDISDLSLRRIRVKMTYKPTEKLMFVLQGGTTNVNVNAKGSNYFDLLDAYAEYAFNDKITVGAGRSTWRGLSRFTTGPLNTLLYDLPAYATSNAGATDYTVRELSAYVKGQLGKFDYRLIVADPYTMATADPKPNVSTFSKNSPHKDFSGYFRYAFLDTENISTPFNSGTYVGKKNVLSLGAGFDYIHNAMWHQDAAKNTVNNDMKSFAVDLFYDAPLNKEKGTSVSAYAMAMHNDYGPNYVRYVGTNNPATSADASMASLNGAGNAMPVIGTGNTYYLQLGGILPYFNKEKKDLQLQPAVGIQLSDLKGLHDNAVIYDAGVSLLLNGMSSRLTFDAQNRPVFTNDPGNNAVVPDRKWQFVLKYRIDFN